MAGEKQRVSLNIAPHVSKFIKGDRSKINRILINLIGNAIKFTPKNGRIDIDVLLETPHLKIIIKDSGIGIEEQKLKDIFRPFEQVDSNTTRAYDGTGLGLSICNKLCSLMNAQLQVQSCINEGSTFTIRLPYQQGGEPIKSPETIQLKTFKRTSNILVVEDNPTNQKVYIHMLKRMGLGCNICHNGVQGLEIISHKKPDLVFLDLHMPLMDGETVLRKLRESYTLEQLPVVVVSAEAFKDRREFIKNLGANEFICKPFSISDLHHVCETFIEEETSSTVDENATSNQVDKGLKNRLAKCLDIPFSQMDRIADLIESEIEQANHTLRPHLDELLDLLYKGDEDAFINYFKNTLPDKVLIIDDQPQVIRLLRSVLGKLGYETGFLSNPKFIEERLRTEHFDLILLDYHLGTTNAELILTNLFQLELKLPPILVMTADHNEQIIIKCFELGASDFIRKPISTTILKARVEAAIDSQKYLRLIEDHSSELEKLVAERTRELEAANKSLDDINKAFKSLYLTFLPITFGNKKTLALVTMKSLNSAFFSLILDHSPHYQNIKLLAKH